jgi:hypothetical protein
MEMKNEDGEMKNVADLNKLHCKDCSLYVWYTEGNGVCLMKHYKTIYPSSEVCSEFFPYGNKEYK